MVQGGGLPDVLAGKSSKTKIYGKRVVCDTRETAKQYDKFQASLRHDIPVKKPHNPNRFDLVLFLQRCCSNEQLPELPQTPAIRRGLRVLMLELNIPERDLRKMYKYWLEVDRDGSGSVDLFELLMWFDFERTEFMVNTCVGINQWVLPSSRRRVDGVEVDAMIHTGQHVQATRRRRVGRARLRRVLRDLLSVLYFYLGGSREVRLRHHGC